MNKERVSILYAGLAGFISIALIQLLSIEELDTPLVVALICFTIALPFLILFILSTQFHFQSTFTNVPVFYLALSSVTVFVGFAGIAALFWHFHPLLGKLVIGTSFAAMWLFNLGFK